MIETYNIKPLRIIGVLCFLTAMLLGSPSQADAATEPVVAHDVTLKLEGKTLPQPVPPIIVDDRLYIGVRAVGEAVGGVVDWNPDTRQVTVTRRSDKLVLTIDKPGAMLNGQPVSLETPPLIYADRTMVPLRFISETLGGGVNWEATTRTADILAKPARITAIDYTNGVGKATYKLTFSEPLTQVAPQQAGSKLAFTLYPALATGATLPPKGDGLVKAIGLTEGWRQVRFELEFSQVPTHRHKLSPDGTQLIIELDHMVTGAAFQKEGRIAMVNIAGTGKLSYTTLKLTNPDRLVVDIPGRLAPGTPASVDLNQGFLQKVRLAQFKPDTVRAVIDMSANPPAKIVQTDQGLQVQFVPQITAVKTERLSGKAKITFTGTLPVDATVKAVPDKKQVLITIPQGISGLTAPTVKVADGAIDTITVAPAGNNASLITIQLPYYLGHTVLSKNGEAAIVLEVVASPIYGKRIWIDAGHGKVPGGKDDPGTIGKVLKVYEKDVNLKVALELQKLLQAAGATVYMTRTGNEGPDFTNRPALVNALKPPVDLFLSIHHNSAASPTVRGIETYYWTTNPKSKRVAELVHPQVVKALGFPDRRIRSDSFFVIKATLAPSVLLELGYLSSPEEEKAIADPKYPARAAEGIKNGVFQYYWQEIQPATTN